MNRLVAGVAFSEFALRVVVAADDLLAGRFAAGVVVADAKANHVDAHIGG